MVKEGGVSEVSAFSPEAAAVTLYLCQSAYLVQKLPDFVHVSVEVDVPQRPRCLTGVFEPPPNPLIQILLLQTLQYSYTHTHKHKLEFVFFPFLIMDLKNKSNNHLSFVFLVRL